MSQKQNNIPEFDPNQPFEVVEASASVPEFDPNQPFEEVEESTPKKKEHKISQGKAFIKGVEQGATFGFSDEIEGGIAAGTDAVHTLLNKIGVVDSPSASQANAKLKAEGFTGDIGPDTLGGVYTEARDESRDIHKAAQEQHFWTSLAGNLAGGVGTGVGLAGLAKAGVTSAKVANAAMNPIRVAKDASLAAKVNAGMANAVVPSAIAGAGITEADLVNGGLEDYKQFGNDVIDATKVGVGVGGAMPVMGAIMKGVGTTVKGAGNLIPDRVKTAFKRGTEGTDLAEPDIDDKIRGKVNETVDEVAPAISQERGKQAIKDQELSDWFMKQVNNVKSTLEGGAMQIENEAAKATKLERFELLKNNRALKQKLAKELNVTEAQMDNAIREQSDIVRAELNQMRDQVKSNLNSAHQAKVKSAMEQEQEIAQKLAEKRAALDTRLEQSKTSTTQKLSELQDEVATHLDLEKQKQIANNEARLNDLNKRTVETAKKLQAKVGQVKKDLGKEYDEIEKAANQAQVKPENRDVIGFLQDEIQNKSFLPKGEDAKILRKIEVHLGNKDYASFKALKTKLNNLFNHPNLNVSRAAKQAYKMLHNNYAQSLDDAGEAQLAARIKDTNNRWSAAMDIEDGFVGTTQADRVTGEMLADPTTVRTIGKFAQNTPEQMAETEAFVKKLGVLTPEAPQTVDEISGLAKQMQSAKDFKPNVPSKEEALASNPEVARLQNLLSEIKAGKPIDDVTRSLSDEINTATQQLDEAKAALTQTKAARPTGLEVSTKVKEIEKYQQLVDTLKQLRATKANGQSGNQQIDELVNKAKSIRDQIDQTKLQYESDKLAIPSKSERLSKNDEYQRLKATLDTVKRAKNVPETQEELQNIRSIIKETLGDEKVAEFDTMVANNMAPEDSIVNIFDRNPNKLKDMLTKLLPKYTRGSDVEANKIDSLIKFLGENKGEGYAKDFSKRLKDLADDVTIRDAKDTGRFRATYAANQAGVLAKHVVKAVTVPKEILTKGIKSLSDLDDAAMSTVVTKLKSMGPRGEEYARVLEGTVNKTQQSKNAIIFGLMQQPGFRDVMNLMQKDEQDNGQ